MFACLLFVNETADLMLHYFIQVVYLVRLGSAVHVKCGKTVFMRAEHLCRKTAFISDTTRNTRTCLLSRDIQLQTHKRQSNKLVKQWSPEKRYRTHFQPWRCFLLSRRHMPPAYSDRLSQEEHSTCEESLQLLKWGEDRHKTTQDPNTGLLTIETASQPGIVAQHLGSRGRRSEASLGYRVRLLLQKEKDIHKL